MEILAYKKQTENKIRWDADVDGAPFELYVPKWRIPVPAPDRIRVEIAEAPPRRLPEQHRKSAFQQSRRLRATPIFAELIFESEHTKTRRFDPVGDSNLWEVGSCYIPKSLIEDFAGDQVFLKVEWD